MLKSTQQQNICRLNCHFQLASSSTHAPVLCDVATTWVQTNCYCGFSPPCAVLARGSHGPPVAPRHLAEARAAQVACPPGWLVGWRTSDPANPTRGTSIQVLEMGTKRGGGEKKKKKKRQKRRTEDKTTEQRSQRGILQNTMHVPRTLCGDDGLQAVLLPLLIYCRVAVRRRSRCCRAVRRLLLRQRVLGV